ncbi:F390 synthetase-related protein [Nocardioides speluncae]|uniref:F390 synthetase-related protein n=1 Tax=Nocardioides speluncae TaxID=2670337 RepID=UPI00137AA2C9|nr:F390 synthetase-related protein [Nocardioides speluncae]
MGATFAHDRWLPGQRWYDARRARALARFLRRDLPRASFYAPYVGRPLAELPVVDKATVLADFAGFNRYGVTLEQAMDVAREAERTRDFTPTVHGVTVGLSSGTSGRPGVFLVSDRERRRWAGALMAQLLAPASLRIVARRAPLKVALFLRANSNLYETLGSSRVEFRYCDLTRPLEEHVAAVSDVDVLVGPPSVLRQLTTLVALRPTQVIAAAETLEPDDAAAIEAAYGVPVEQIYQATEGLLGVSCPERRVHLNEGYVHIEPQWLDNQGLDDERFVPIVTDFTRTTQLVVRYRLDDVLLAADGPCPCGRPGRSVRAVLGRCDDVLDLRGTDVQTVSVFPDVLRHAMAFARPNDYRVEQHGEIWRIALRGATAEQVEREIGDLAERLHAPPPKLETMPWPVEAATDKRRRIRRVRGLD